MSILFLLETAQFGSHGQIQMAQHFEEVVQLTTTRVMVLGAGCLKKPRRVSSWHQFEKFGAMREAACKAEL